MSTPATSENSADQPADGALGVASSVDIGLVSEAEAARLPVTTLIEQTVLREAESTLLAKLCALTIVFGVVFYSGISLAENYGRKRLATHPIVRRAHSIVLRTGSIHARAGGRLSIEEEPTSIRHYQDFWELEFRAFNQHDTFTVKLELYDQQGSYIPMSMSMGDQQIYDFPK